tara:strand:+ start:575 stop:880 length:306 start_codon:yes stop_codon:yes gene_type:complete
MNDLEKLIQIRDIAIKAVEEFKDGFEYKVVCSAYGSSHTVDAPNSRIAKEIGFEYNGDNGYATIYTNNVEFVKANNPNEYGNVHDWGEGTSLVLFFEPKTK